MKSFSNFLLSFTNLFEHYISIFVHEKVEDSLFIKPLIAL